MRHVPGIGRRVVIVVYKIPVTEIESLVLAEEKIRIVLEGLRSEAAQLKEALAEMLLENRLLKKYLRAGGDDT